MAMQPTEAHIVCSGCVHSKTQEYLTNEKGRIVFDASGMPIVVGAGTPTRTPDVVGSLQEQHYYTLIDCTEYGIGRTKVYFCTPDCHAIYMERRQRATGIMPTSLSNEAISEWRQRSAALAAKEAHGTDNEEFGPPMQPEL